MNDHVSSLYTLAHELLNLGMDDSPIEIIGELRNLEENQYPFEVID